MRKSTPAGPLTLAVFHIQLALYGSETVHAAFAGLKHAQLGLPLVKHVLTVGAMIVALGAWAAMLAGCATANVFSIVSSNISSPRPAEILVDVRSALNGDDPNAHLAAEISGKLEAGLIKKLTKAGVAAAAYAPGTARAGAATLHVAIMGAAPGNMAERFLIGFGVGRARLQVSAELETDITVPGESMTKFVISSNSGYKPGVIVPGAVAAATGNLIPLAIGGGIKIATSISNGMILLVPETTTAIVDQLEKYYKQAGWVWPMPS